MVFLAIIQQMRIEAANHRRGFQLQGRAVDFRHSQRLQVLIVLLIVVFAFGRVALLHILLAEIFHSLHSLDNFEAEVRMCIFMAEEVEGDGAPKAVTVADHLPMGKSMRL